MIGRPEIDSDSLMTLTGATVRAGWAAVRGLFPAHDNPKAGYVSGCVFIEWSNSFQDRAVRLQWTGLLSQAYDRARAAWLPSVMAFLTADRSVPPAAAALALEERLIEAVRVDFLDAVRTHLRIDAHGVAVDEWTRADKGSPAQQAAEQNINAIRDKWKTGGLALSVRAVEALLINAMDRALETVGPDLDALLQAATTALSGTPVDAPADWTTPADRRRAAP